LDRAVVNLQAMVPALLFLCAGVPLAALLDELGLFDEVVATDELEELTYGFAETVCSRAQFSVRAGKVMVDKVVGGQVRDDDATTELRNSSFDTEDFTEGVRAFMAKRSPSFTWS
jgi:enoyl-CoA hydratase/carnithine racemase